jgi:cell division initiation protein
MPPKSTEGGLIMLTPLDIENKKFRKRLLGYNELEVEEFLTKVVEDYEKLYKENIELKDKVSVLNEGIQHYKSIEETLQNTLLIAQTTGEDIKNNAYEKSGNIINEAQINANKMISDANQKILDINYKFEEVKRSFNTYKSKAESLLLTQLDLLKNINHEEKDKDV